MPEDSAYPLLLAQLNETRAELREAQREIQALRQRLDELDSRTNLISSNLFARAFAVWGHYLLANLILLIPLLIVLFLPLRR